MSYISFPNALNAFLLSDIKGREADFGITYDIYGYRNDIYLFPDSSPKESTVTIVDKKDAAFVNCFANKFIYQVFTSTPPDINLRVMEIIHSDLDDDTKRRERKKIEDMNILFLTHSLHNFVNEHIEKGKFVEIYNVWTDHISVTFDSPTLEYAIKLNDLLNPFDTPDIIEFMQHSAWKERVKLTVFKT